MAPEGKGDETTPPLMCAKGCGFFGNAATRNLCSKCYNTLLVEKLIKAVGSTEEAPTMTPPEPRATCGAAAEDAIVGGGLEEQQAGATLPRPPRPRRCDGCKKKVGLLGFDCRCGGTFCGAHRHSEQHHCTFDFRAAGRDAIAKANPLVKADKLQRI